MCLISCDNEENHKTYDEDSQGYYGDDVFNYVAEHVYFHPRFLTGFSIHAFSARIVSTIISIASER